MRVSHFCQNDCYWVSFRNSYNRWRHFCARLEYIVGIITFVLNNLEMYSIPPKRLCKNCKICSIDLFCPELFHIDIESQKSLNVEQDCLYTCWCESVYWCHCHQVVEDNLGIVSLFWEQLPLKDISCKREVFVRVQWIFAEMQRCLSGISLYCITLLTVPSARQE